MAGLPWGIPAGTIGGKGMDLSPWLAYSQMQQQAQAQAQARQMQQAQFQQQMQQENDQRAFNNQLTEFRLKTGLEQDKLAREDRLTEIGLRKQESEADRALRERGLGLQERELGLRESELGFRTGREARAEKERGELELKGQARQKAFGEARARVAQTASALAQGPGATQTMPETIRDYMLQKMQMDPAIQDKEAEAAAIQEWYESAVQTKERLDRETLRQEDLEFKRKREERLAEDDRLTLEFKRDQLADAQEQKKQQKKAERAEKATEVERKILMDLGKKISDATIMVQRQQHAVGALLPGSPEFIAASNRLAQYAATLQALQTEAKKIEAQGNAKAKAIMDEADEPVVAKPARST